MTLVLGIDAAWTATQPSGVALVASQGSTWRCVAVAPSYAAFDHLSRGTALDWADRPRGELPVAASLVAAVERLAGRPPDVIAIDMPLSHRPIVARRAADAAVHRRGGVEHPARRQVRWQRLPPRVPDQPHARRDSWRCRARSSASVPPSRVVVAGTGPPRWITPRSAAQARSERWRAPSPSIGRPPRSVAVDGVGCGCEARSPRVPSGRPGQAPTPRGRP
jgi:hypothetical protein